MRIFGAAGGGLLPPPLQAGRLNKPTTEIMVRIANRKNGTVLAFNNAFIGTTFLKGLCFIFSTTYEI